MNDDDEFEDDYFEYDTIDTGARINLGNHEPKSGGSKVIQSNREQQINARRMMQERLAPSNGYRLRFGNGGTGTSGTSGTSDPSNGIPHSQMDLNVTISKEHETIPEPVPISNEEMKYHVSKHVEHNRDLYFVRLVAGSMKRSFESMINVEQRKDTGTTNLNGKVVISVKYFYNNELLHAWASIIERVKLMINERTSGWIKTEDIHEKLINVDTTCVAFARYVAFVIMTESNVLVPRNRTRYSIDNDAQIEDKMVVNLMRSIHSEYGILKQNIVQRFL